MTARTRGRRSWSSAGHFAEKRVRGCFFAILGGRLFWNLNNPFSNIGLVQESNVLLESNTRFLSKLANN